MRENDIYIVYVFITNKSIYNSKTIREAARESGAVLRVGRLERAGTRVRRRACGGARAGARVRGHACGGRAWCPTALQPEGRHNRSSSTLRVDVPLNERGRGS